MIETGEKNLLLDPYRGLDLTEGGYLFCGKILADLGADIVKVEPPGGSASRNIGPFYKDIPDPEKSLYWFAYNTNKRGITLSIETADGRELFENMVKRVDFVLESFTPGYLDRLGLGYRHLRRVNPGIIIVSMTPFGQTGPKAKYKSYDLTTWGSGAVMFMTGDSDRPPVAVTCQQAALHGGAYGANAAMVALWRRATSGKGCHVDVSTQQAIIKSTYNAAINWDMCQQNIDRAIYGVMNAMGVRLRFYYPCKDGYINTQLYGGGFLGQVKSSKRTVEWMAEEGMAPNWLKNLDWVNDLDSSKLTQEALDKVQNAAAKFYLTKTKQELYEGAVKRDILLAPVNNAEDIRHRKQLKARNYWQNVEHDELNDTLDYCGPMVRVMGAAPMAIRRRAPLIGEHNEEVYEKELGLSREKMLLLKQAQVI